MPPSTAEKIKHWRDRAEEYRAAAEACRNPVTADAYKALAASCERMAAEIARREGSGPGKL